MSERHHILFNRRTWNATDELASLRGNRQLIVPLDTYTHRELHEEISHVPPLSMHLARHALMSFEEYGYTSDHLQAIGHLQSSIEAAARHPRADHIEKSLAGLVCHTLDLQKPFIDDSDTTYFIGKYWKVA